MGRLEQAAGLNTSPRCSCESSRPGTPWRGVRPKPHRKKEREKQREREIERPCDKREQGLVARSYDSGAGAEAQQEWLICLTRLSCTVSQFHSFTVSQGLDNVGRALRGRGSCLGVSSQPGIRKRERERETERECEERAHPREEGGGEGEEGGGAGEEEEKKKKKKQ